MSNIKYRNVLKNKKQENGVSIDSSILLTILNVIKMKNPTSFIADAMINVSSSYLALYVSH